MKSKKVTIYQLTFMAMMAAVTCILGPTGGYLIGFIFMALIGGAVIELSHRNIFLTMLGWGVII